MKKLIKYNFNKSTLFRIFIIVVALVFIPVGYSIFGLNQHSFISPLDYFEFNISLFLPFLFPLLAVLIFTQSFSNELLNNYILYTHTRVDFLRYINSKLVANSILVFFSFFIVIFFSFLLAYYVEPLIGLITYQPEQLNLSAHEIIHYNSNLFTFSQLIHYSPWLMAGVYSLWVGVNAVLYSTMAMLAIFLISNLFVALSLPFLFYHISSFIIAVLGFPRLLFDATIFPFNVDQQPIATVLIPFSVLLGINLLMYIILIKQIKNKQVNGL